VVFKDIRCFGGHDRRRRFVIRRSYPRLRSAAAQGSSAVSRLGS
jgi:hypothetical protein